MSVPNHPRLLGWVIVAFLLASRARAATGHDVVELLSQSQVEAAEAALSNVPSSDPLLHWARADLAFHKGDYPAAREALTGSSPPPEPLAWLPERIDGAARATLPMLERKEGRFIVRFAPGADAILVDPVVETLTRQLAALDALLGPRVPGPILVEFFPTQADFVLGSGLPEAWVRTTNTVAIAKWDRLLILSPMNAAWGYPWLDTAAHELVHLVLSRASRNTLPIWFQEGSAKTLECAWRDCGPQDWLDPRSESLLFAARRDNQLIAFQRLHPSIAAMPSVGEAVLAYAEVASAVGWIRRQAGDAGYRRIVETTALHGDVMRAVDQILGGEAGSFERRWQAWLASERLQPRADVAELQRDLSSGAARGGDAEGTQVDSVLAENERARSLAQVGDLLRGRGHVASSLIEYDKAARLASFHSPSLAHKRALALIRLQRAKEAQQVLEESVALYPEFTPCVVSLAQTTLNGGDRKAAEGWARRAIGLNPFDPIPHQILGKIAADRGDEAAVTRTRRVLQVLADHLRSP